MSLPAIVYRDRIVRAVLGRPAASAPLVDASVLDRICEHLANCEAAHDMLRAKGYGDVGMLINEVLCALPDAPGKKS